MLLSSPPFTARACSSSQPGPPLPLQVEAPQVPEVPHAGGVAAKQIEAFRGGMVAHAVVHPAGGCGTGVPVARRLATQQLPSRTPSGW